MSLKFSFDGSQQNDHQHGSDAASPGIPLPFAGAPSTGSTSNVLELRVTIEGDEVMCNGLSGDGVSYAKASRRLSDDSIGALAVGVCSALARTGATLPEPLIESVTAIVLDLAGREAEVLTELGLMVATGADQLAAVDEALQARSGVSAGTPIRRA